MGLSPNEIIQGGGWAACIAIIMAIAVGGLRRTWVFWHYVEDERKVSKERLDEMRQDRDEARGLLESQAKVNIELTQQNEKLTGIVETLTDIVQNRLMRLGGPLSP